ASVAVDVGAGEDRCDRIAGLTALQHRVVAAPRRLVGAVDEIDDQVVHEVAGARHAVVEDHPVVDRAHLFPRRQRAAGGGGTPRRIGEHVGDPVEVTAVEQLGVAGHDRPDLVPVGHGPNGTSAAASGFATGVAHVV